MARGTVKWFGNERGYGFIEPDDGSQDLFVHFSQISKPGYKFLREGETVEFEAAEGAKGPEARSVFPV